MCEACGNIGLLHITSEFKGLDLLFRKVWDKVIKRGDVDRSLYLSTSEKLFGAVEEGYSHSLLSLDYGTPDYKMLDHIRTNVYVFSAFKTYQELREITDVLADSKTFNDFKKKAIPIHDEYDGRFLEAEYNTAVASGRSVSQWQEIQEAKKHLPFLRYRTMEDSLVRPAHAVLDGIIRAVDDPFWDTYMPPNDWNCRCDVEQVGEDGKPTKNPAHPELKKMFRNNVGKTGIVFPESHPYYKVAEEDKAKAKALFGMKVPPVKPKKP